MVKFRTKNVFFFFFFDQNAFIWAFLDWSLKKNTDIFQIGVLEFLFFGAKIKIFKSEIQNASFGYFWAEI